MIRQKEARQIAKKLKGELRPGRRHDIVAIHYEGKRITQFGIPRGSRDLPHSYIPRQLYVSPAQALELAACPMSADEYFRTLIDKGLIEES